MEKALVGVVGGSGLYEMEALEDAQELQIDTPYGKPSDAIMTGRIDGVPVAFLSRHGRGHRLVPTEIPYRANLYALKTLGVRYLISLSAVGSLREEFRPLDMVLPDQFIDLTRKRDSSFFGDGAVAHVSMGQPVCPQLAGLIERAVDAAKLTEPVKVHRGGTYVCIEGPQFSTMAESHWFRSMGASVIGMTNMPEAKLAREAQMAYASLNMVTDYDAWHPTEAHVTADAAIANLSKNAERAQHIARAAVVLVGAEQPMSAAHSALSRGLVSPLESLAADVRERLDLLLR